MDPIYLARAIARTLVLPPTGPLLLAALGLLLIRRRPRLGRALAWLGVLSLLALSLPVVATLLLRAVGETAPFDPAQARGAQAIVVLGGGVRPYAPEYGGPALGRYTLERVRYGAHVARLTGLPVLVSGGALHPGAVEADVMRAALEREFGVAVTWAEGRSRDTHENAVFAAELLRAAGVTRVVLVTHAPHIPRARAEFEQAGLEVVPAPAYVAGPVGYEIGDYLPSLGGLQASHYALYELLGNLTRRVLRG